MAKFLAGLMEAGMGVVNAIGIRHGESTARALTPEWDYAAQWAHRHRWEAKRDRLMRPFRAPAFFQAQRKDDDGIYPMLPIDEAVAWSRTAFGGKQFEMFAPTSADTGCVRWGLCDTGPVEAAP